MPLTFKDAQFYVTRHPTAFSVVPDRLENYDEIPGVIAAMTNTGQRGKTVLAIRVIVRCFIHERHITLSVNHPLQTFNPELLKCTLLDEQGSTFDLCVDEENQKVTIALSPTITLMVFREVRHEREAPLHFRLIFKDPAQGAKALKRRAEEFKGGPPGVSLRAFEFEAPITIVAKIYDGMIMGPSVRLLGERLEHLPRDWIEHGCEKVRIVPLEGEQLVVYGDCDISHALGITNTIAEANLRHPNPMAFASVILPDGVGITLTYLPAPPRTPGGTKSRGLDRIVAYVDRRVPVRNAEKDNQE